MLDFGDEEPTRPIPYESLSEAARKWREETARANMGASHETPKNEKVY